MEHKRTKFHRVDSPFPRWLALGVVLLAFCGCQGQVATGSGPVRPAATQPSTPSFTVTPAGVLTPTSEFAATPTVSSTASVCDGNQLYQITTQPVRGVQWSAKENTLFFVVEDSRDYWAYSFEAAASATLSQGQCLSCTANSGSILFRMPDDVVWIHHSDFSPSKLIFAREHYDGLTPTPDSGMGNLRRLRHDLFILEKGYESPRYFGQVDGPIDTFVWFPDERQVLIFTDMTHILWGDSDTGELRPLFSVQQYLGRVLPIEQMISPSGEKVIFAQERHLGPIPTPDTVGEGSGSRETRSDLFVMEGDMVSPRYLGQIDSLVERFTWFPDEERVLISTDPRYPGTSSTWIVDLDSREFMPLFPCDDWKLALSPDGTQLLYRAGDVLTLRDLASGQERELPVPFMGGRVYYWFVSTDRLLVINHFGGRTPDHRVSMFNLQSNKLCQVYDLPLQIESVALSPNHDYLAIQWMDTRLLYVLPICDEKCN